VFERALAKDPAARFGGAGELVAALRDAFDADAGATRVAAPAPAPLPVEPTPPAPRPPAPPRRTIGPLGIVLTVLALALLGGLVAYALTRDDDEPQSQQPEGRTVVRTLVTTAPGTTQRVTVTTQAEEPPPEEEEPPPQQQGGDGVALTDQSTQLLNDGRYEEALPIAQQALAALQGSGELYEAYANYNVGKSLLGLGRCAEAIPYFDRSEQIQGERKEITRDRKAAEKCA
jgi:tetratricopeptide (TPR) repeat protein